MKSKSEKIIILANKIKQGNELAFNQLFELLWESLFVYAKSMLMDEEKAKDIVQEIWIDYWNRRQTIKTSYIQSYLFKAVKNKVYTHFRNTNLNTVQIQVIEELTCYSEIEEEHNYEHTVTYIDALISELPNRCREIFKLSKLRGLTNEEIAINLGISKRSVENQLSLAIRRLKKSF